MDNIMLQDISEVYISKEQLNEITERIGKQISLDYAGKDLVMMSVLKGSVVFMADLMRNITIPCEIEFITAESYGAVTKSSGDVKISNNFIKRNLNGCDILIVEDILDSGLTLQKLTDVLKKESPASIRICTLLDKPERRNKSVTITANYIGTKIKNEFVVGYGLDYNQKYRNLPFIGILKPEVYQNK